MRGGFKCFMTMEQSPELAVLKIHIKITDSHLFPRHTKSEDLAVVRRDETLDGPFMSTL
jgi:hypothetical protein